MILYSSITLNLLLTDNEPLNLFAFAKNKYKTDKRMYPQVLATPQAVLKCTSFIRGFIIWEFIIFLPL